MVFSKLLVGIDESGRGPVIGDMFVALVALDPSRIDILKSLGVRDSKSLTPESRFRLLPHILSNALISIVSRVPPHILDEYNINSVYVNTIIKLLKTLLCHPVSRGVKTLEIYVDASGNPEKLKDMLYRKIVALRHGKIINIVVEFKADAKFTVVSAASIVAKVLRDSHIEALKAIYGDFGSGYPSDQRTIEWIRKYFEIHGTLPSIVRKSWKTVQKILGKESGIVSRSRRPKKIQRMDILTLDKFIKSEESEH